MLETVYGFQEGGDLAPLPFAITQDSAMFGANLGVRYRLTERLHTALRAPAGKGRRELAARRPGGDPIRRGE